MRFYGAWSMLWEGQKCYVMGLELCEGNLEELISRRRPKPFSAAELRRCKALAEGLAHLHRHRVMHRDLKAGNVFLRTAAVAQGAQGLYDLALTEMELLLGDLGAGKLGSRAQTPVQTPHFMAPEVARMAGDYGAAADVWGFGCLLFQMLEMGLPHGEDGRFEGLLRIFFTSHDLFRGSK